jgi:hypothetical protein
MSRTITILTAVAVLATVSRAARAQVDPALDRALGALRQWQQFDGGFTNGFSEGSDVGTTADAMLALVAAGVDPATWNVDAGDPLGYLQEQVRAGGVAGPGLAAKVAMAVVVSGGDPAEFGGADLIAVIRDGYDDSTGLFGGGPFDSALAITALEAAGLPLPEGALEGLLSAQLSDGSFSFSGDTTEGAGDSNTTALVVQALVAANSSDAIASALDYFRGTQNADGGWTYQKPSAFGEETDANSTALVIQALMAAGEDLDAWGNPQETLLALQVPSGAFIYTRSTSAENVLATLQAIPVLAGVSYADVAEQGSRLGAQVTAQTTHGEGLVLAVLGLLVVVLAAGVLAGRRSVPDQGG